MDHLTANMTKPAIEPLDVRYGVYTMFGTIIFFQILNKIFAFFGKPRVIHPGDFWRWRNLLCSWSHAFMTGSLTLYCILAYPHMHDDMILFAEPLAYLTVAFSTGYFLYDTGDMIMARELFPNWEVVLHHVAVTSMFFYNTITFQCIGYNMYALLAEVNSFFLHTRKLMQMLKTEFDNPFYRFNNLINLISFAIFRGLSIGMIFKGMLDPVECSRVSWTYFLSLCGADFVMMIINPVLFVRLLKNDFLRSSKPKPIVDNNNSKNDDGPQRFNLTEKDD